VRQVVGVTWRLHRSLIFWGGLMVMISLGWAWWDSSRAGSFLENDPKWALWSDSSEIHFKHYGISGMKGDWRVTRDPHLTPFTRISMELPRVYYKERGVHLVVPHFWLLLGAAAVWIGMLVWRWRRMKRAMVVREGGER
jgi:hypothetical protein